MLDKALEVADVHIVVVSALSAVLRVKQQGSCKYRQCCCSSSSSSSQGEMKQFRFESTLCFWF